MNSTPKRLTADENSKKKLSKEGRPTEDATTLKREKPSTAFLRSVIETFEG